MGRLGKFFWVLCAVSVISGCDPVTTHKITSTIFDGVPSLPPAEQYCREYHENKLAEEEEAAKRKQLEEAKVAGSAHRPYAEKRCDDCHDKSKESGLIRPRDQICFVCHPNINKGAFVHGPASVGGCLECHEPHSSSNPSLLKTDRATLCNDCHREKRLTAEMHKTVMSKGMFCMDCHNPHSSNVRYFLK